VFKAGRNSYRGGSNVCEETLGLHLFSESNIENGKQ
jgi:hypothetical protein